MASPVKWAGARTLDLKEGGSGRCLGFGPYTSGFQAVVLCGCGLVTILGVGAVWPAGVTCSSQYFGLSLHTWEVKAMVVLFLTHGVCGRNICSEIY